MVWTIASPFSFQAQSVINTTYLSRFRVKGEAPPGFTLGYVRGGGFEVSDTVGGIYIVRVALAYQNGDIGRMPMRSLSMTSRMQEEMRRLKSKKLRRKD